MGKIILIPCGSKKLDKFCKAQELYVGVLFKKCFEYAKKLLKEKQYDKIYILSDKHHLLEINRKLLPYTCIPLSKKKISERKKWANEVLEDLKKVCNLKSDKFLILAGKSYWEFLIGEIEQKNCEIPMQGLRIGEQLNFLNSKIK